MTDAIWGGWAVDALLDGSTWTDITADVLTNNPPTCTYGINGEKPGDRVSGTGRMSLSLNNSTSNSAGLLGYYSPGHDNCRTGFDLNLFVRLRVTLGNKYGTVKYGEGYYGGEYVKFIGKVKTLQVSFGSKRQLTTDIEVLDYMNDLGEHKINLTEIAQSVRSDEAFQLVLDNVPSDLFTPTITSYAGQETFAYWGDDLKDEKTTALAALQKIALSEFGYVYMRGAGTDIQRHLVFEDRHTRYLSTTAMFTFTEGNIVDMTCNRPIDEVYNYIDAIAYPREVSSDTEEIMFSLQTPVEITAGATITLEGRFTDPNSRSSRISGANMITPVDGTDYKFSATEGGAGTDLNSSLTITADYGANAVLYTLTNTGAVSGFLNVLQARGTPIRIYEPLTYTAEDASSQTTYGKHELSLGLPYQESYYTAKDFGDATLALYKSPHNVYSGVTIIGSSGDMGRACLGLEPGDRITVSESVTDMSGDYIVHALNFSIVPPNYMRVSFLLKSASTDRFWILGAAGYSEIGTTTVLGV